MQGTQVNLNELTVNGFRTIDSQDWTKFAALLSDNGKFHLPGRGALDKKTYLEFTKQWYAAFPDGAHQVDAVNVDGNNSFVRGYYSGTQRGEFNGIPATNKKVNMSFLWQARFENNLVVEMWVEFDGVSMLTQLGAIPAPPQ